MTDDSVIAFLKKRQSVPLSMIKGPGPDETQLNTLLEIAMRVPDHGRLEPWRFIIYRPEHAKNIGDLLLRRARQLRSDMPESEFERERKRLNRAPLAIGVVSKPHNHPTIPQWEQFLSAGAAAMNLVSAATAMGFAANWVTGWYSDDQEGRQILGLAPEERMAGIVHIGSCDREIAARPRPDTAALASEYAGPYEGD